MAANTNPRLAQSDEQLRSQKFRYSDPEHTIQGLDRSVPAADAGVTVIGYYDETPSGGMKGNPDFPFVWCCHCQKRTHWLGYVIQSGTGAIHLIGQQNCGRLHYGVDFGGAERTFKQKRDRQRALERLAGIAAASRSAIAEVSALLWTESLSSADLVRASLKSAAPAFYSDLCAHICAGSVMKVHRTVRDHEAERERDRRFEQAVAAFQRLPAAIRRERRDEGLSPEEDTTPIFQQITEQFGQVVGGSFLVDEGDLRGALLALRKALLEAHEAFKAGTDSCSTKHLQALAAAFDRSQRECLETAERFGAAPQFFRSENLNRLAAWARSRDGLVVDVGSSKLAISEGDRQLKTIEAFETLDISALRSSLESIQGTSSGTR